MALKKSITRYIDPATLAAAIIDYAHYEIHSGSSFSVLYSRVTANSDNHRTAIAFSTPDTTKWGHMVFTVSASGPAEVFLLEAMTIDDDAGTQATIKNRNRNSSKTSTMLSLETVPTANEVTTFDETAIAAANFSGGTELAYEQLGGGLGVRAIGGTSRGAQEWILKQNTKYIIYLQNVGANTNTHTISLDWYEHTNK